MVIHRYPTFKSHTTQQHAGLRGPCLPAAEAGRGAAVPGTAVAATGEEKAGTAACPWGNTGMVGEPAFSDRLATPAVRLWGGVFRGT